MLDNKEFERKNIIHQTIIQGTVTGKTVDCRANNVVDTMNYIEPLRYLNILEQVIREAKYMPEADKRTIISKIKDLKDNQWIAGIGSATIVEIAKKLFGQ